MSVPETIVSGETFRDRPLGLDPSRMDVLLVLAVLAVVLLVIAGPLRAGLGTDGSDEAVETGERAELEGAKEAKLREIREAELDYRTGKLSVEDWRELDSELRADAIELLRLLDALEGGRPDR